MDAIYMTATQILTGHGGWPNSVFLTPSLEPFYAGTYFPPEDLSGRPGFPRVLEAVRTAWTERRPEVEQVASGLAERVRRAQALTDEPREPSAEVVAEAVEPDQGPLRQRQRRLRRGPRSSRPPCAWSCCGRSTPREGERGGGVASSRAPWRRWPGAGIHDHVGGGFHRYATDAGWRVPHLREDALQPGPDAAPLRRAYLSTGDDRWRRVAEGILRYVGGR